MKNYYKQLKTNKIMTRQTYPLSSILLTDAYKLSHHSQYPIGTSLVFSNFTPRGNKYAPAAVQALNGVVVFGVQMAIQKLVEHFDENFFFTKERNKIVIDSGNGFADTMNKGLLNQLKESAIAPIREQLSRFFGAPYNMDHFEELWDTGYLPIEVRSLAEGTLCPIKVPMLTIHNDPELPQFYWLPNFLESILSQYLWKPMTSATIALAYKKILTKWARKTNVENGMEFVNWQGHDFSMRGLDSVDATIASGLGHLTSFYGTDSMPTLWGAAHFYNEPELLAGSVPATEHSVMCAGSKEDELGTFRRLLKTYPTGILSVVSDTWDLWNVCANLLPTLKEEILARDGKLVIRPDSGDPVDILCGRDFDKEIGPEFITAVREKYSKEIVEDGFVDVRYAQSIIRVTQTDAHPHVQHKGVIELLWDVFGGTVNDQGFKVLDPHIGAIYGDSITTERAEAICARLAAKGFASTNVVFGIGSYTYQYNTRDTFGFAMKATYVERSEYKTLPGGIGIPTTVGFEIFKDPITDDGLKKSAKGLLKVVDKDGQLELIDQITWDDVDAVDNELKVLYSKGKFHSQVSLTEIRERVNKLV
jgi:nicotinamide phosphoribosyltransferase